MDTSNLSMFEKWDGCGNTFGIVDYKYLDNNRITEICDSLNVDGIITYQILENKLQDFCWEYFNRDGSCVEMCGNGARCVAKCVSNKINKNELKFINNFGIEMNAIVSGDNVSVKMPFWSDYERIEENVYFVKVGVPHIIKVFSYSPSMDLDRMYNFYNKLSLDRFNTTCNVSVFWTVGPVNCIRTFERGVEKETGACGTACCAAHYGSCQSQKTYVTSSGKKLTVKSSNNELWLSSDVVQY